MSHMQSNCVKKSDSLPGYGYPEFISFITLSTYSTPFLWYFYILPLFEFACSITSISQD